ncbi:CPBP family intramembrane glutamic endopeptidase [Peptostreptococcus faecalis]|uniref:CPBP family intramembrane glutamic endopeptidase n=1 Tax=Peptostreptococcus faecalis TaxID=2045015 RepID=UPI0015E14D61|nr:type II CAAX endopeptidase family protein [Peptostreptococcus faecalis]
MENKNYIKTFITLIIIPLQLLLGELIVKIPSINSDMNMRGVLTLSIAFIGFLIVVLLNKNLLKRDFKVFKKSLWKNIGISIICVILMHLLLYIVRLPLDNLSASKEMDVMSLPLMLSIPLSLIPLMAPFVEEIVFRHHLFYRFEKKSVRIFMFFVSAILFGLIHFNNFNGDIIQTIPYMFMAMFFNLIYLYSKNIWNSITVHFIFNGMNVFMGILGLILLKIVG